MSFDTGSAACGLSQSTRTATDKRYSMIFKVLLILLVLAAPLAAQTYKFGRDITAANICEKNATFGFEPGADVSCSKRSCSSAKPFYFSAKVPEGNYRVTVTFGDKNATSDNTVKAELRRLMVERIATKKGKFATVSFIVNVRRPEFPGGIVKLKDREKTMESWAWDDKLTLEFNGSSPSVSAVTVEKTDVPTVFLLGDSTVCDQPREPYASWGQMLTAFFRPTVAIANHAESGESLRSSLGAMRLDKVLSLLKKGDFVVIQFAHNDEKEKGDGVGAMATFKASLVKYVDAVRAKGATPILVTPMHRRTFDANGKITNSHGEYPDAVRLVGREKAVAVVDLTSISKVLYETLGKDGSGALFKEGDGTHHSNYGAYELALLIAHSLKSQKMPLASHLVRNLPKLDAKKPLPFPEFKIPASPLITDQKPPGN